MPRTRSLAWSELRIGILAVAALLLTVAVIFAVGGQTGFSWQRYTLKTTFPDVGGLKTGAIVRIAGVESGKVTGVEFSGAQVLVTLGISKEMRSRVTEESRASIGSLSLLGDPLIDITASTRGRPLEDGESIAASDVSGQIAGQMAGVARQATVSLEQLNAVLTGVRGGQGTVGKLFTDDDLYKELTTFVSSAQAVTDGINRGHGTLGLLVKDPAAYRQLNESLANLNEMTKRINAGEGSLGRLLRDDTMAKSFTSASGHIDQIAGRLNRGEGTAGKLLTDQQLFDRFNSLAGRIDRLAGSLEQGKGTAGLLLQNGELYENMNGAVTELRSLIGAIRNDPKKYLNVRVSIF